MPTEREVLLKIMNHDADGVPDLFERHAALFHEGLVRFYGEAGPEQAGALTRVIKTLVEDLREYGADWEYGDADLNRARFLWLSSGGVYDSEDPEGHRADD